MLLIIVFVIIKFFLFKDILFGFNVIFSEYLLNVLFELLFWFIDVLIFLSWKLLLKFLSMYFIFL